MIRDYIEEALEQLIDGVENQLKQAKNFFLEQTRYCSIGWYHRKWKEHYIYNWLIDADFKLEIQKSSKQLSASHPTKQIAKMSSKTISETKQLQYDYIEDCNLLVIDFPGFQDTNGQKDDLQTDLVLFKLSQYTPIKIIYVMEQLGNEIPNRGTQLQQFIHSWNFSNNHQNDISIILNKYNEDLDDAEIKDCFINQIKDCDIFNQQQPYNIYNIRHLKSEKRLQEEFSNIKKLAFKKFLIESKTIDLQVRQLANTQNIDQYIMGQKNIIHINCRNIMYEFLDTIKEHFNQANIPNNHTQIQNLFASLQLDQDIQVEDLTLVQVIDLILNKVSLVLENYGIDDIIDIDFQQQYSKFKRIFEFFYQFLNQLKIYQDCKSVKDNLLNDYNNKTNQIKEFIQQKKNQNEYESQQNHNNIIKNVGTGLIAGVATATVTKLVVVSAIVSVMSTGPTVLTIAGSALIGMSVGFVASKI